MKTYKELIGIVLENKQEITDLMRQAHKSSLLSDKTSENCSIVAIRRQDGLIVQRVIDGKQRPDELYILAAYPHINPIEAVVLFADEKAAILNNWCLEQGTMPPEQGEQEGDVAYLSRLVSWIREYTDSTAGEILIDLIRDQLIQDFDATAELQEALEELYDLDRGVVRLPPSEDKSEEPDQNNE